MADQDSPPAYKDLRLSFNERAQDLVGRMTLAEKIGQMVFNAPAIERLDVPAYNWWSEGLHGVARAGYATVFPQAIGLGATWNTDLMEQVATAISDEARAKHHEAVRQGQRGIYQGLTYWSPNINIFRDPRWGRGQETYGEDPYLTARLGVAFVRGMQGDHPRYLKLVATPKHFAVHSGPEFDRHHFDARVSPADLYQTYLPAFEACVREAGAASIMGAYNRTNGEPCCASPTLLEGILRRDWGFDGYVVSDCWAIRDIYKYHRVVGTPSEAAALAVKAGCDLNCGDTYPALGEAVARGLISEADIDRAVTRLFTARMRLGTFDPPEAVPYAQIPPEVNCAPQHVDLALEAARQSLVLLKNDGDFLPLPEGLGTVAVIGPNAHDPLVLRGNYFGTPLRSVTPLEGLQARLGPGTRLLYAPGCGVVDEIPGGVEAALALAHLSDVVIFVGGLSQLLEGEEGQGEGLSGGQRTRGDREDLSLPAAQEALLQALHASGVPVVLVCLNGGPLALNWTAAHLPAILAAWYPGQAGGTAVAEALFGDYNPGGRLPITWYRSAQDLPPFDDYRMAGRTYRYFEGQPLFPFGHGLSYTRFAYRNLELSASSLGREETLTLSVEVQNMGPRAGDEVVQLYVSLPESSHPAPIRQLQGFQRIHLTPGASQKVTFRLPPRGRAVVDDQGRWLVERGLVHLAVGGRQPTPADFFSTGEREAERSPVLFAAVTIEGEEPDYLE